MHMRPAAACLEKHRVAGSHELHLPGVHCSSQLLRQLRGCRPSRGPAGCCKRQRRGRAEGRAVWHAPALLAPDGLHGRQPGGRSLRKLLGGSKVRNGCQEDGCQVRCDALLRIVCRLQARCGRGWLLCRSRPLRQGNAAGVQVALEAPPDSPLLLRMRCWSRLFLRRSMRHLWRAASQRLAGVPARQRSARVRTLVGWKAAASSLMGYCGQQVCSFRGLYR